ncbi:MAG: hypothetical protein R2710_01085 [Acidimicrobiales bacterium]
MDLLADVVELERAADEGWDGTEFEPVRRRSTCPAPTANVAPRPIPGWIRRTLPVVLDNRLDLLRHHRPGGHGDAAAGGTAGGAAFSAIDQALTQRSVGLNRFVIAVLVIGLVRSALTLTYRFLLYRGAFQIDTDLRILLYDHLTAVVRLLRSHPVRPGDLAANSDIRSVQMFLTFAAHLDDDTDVHVGDRVHAVGQRATGRWSPIAPLPGVYWMGVPLRNQVLPLSWIVQSRLAGGGDDGRREHQRRACATVRGRRAPDQPAGRCTQGCAGPTSAPPTARRATIPIENLPCVGMGLVLVYGGWLVIQGEVTEGTLFALHRLRHHAAGAVPHARHASCSDSERKQISRAHLRDPRRGARCPRPARCGAPAQRPG